jgi:hypothetical protein
MRLAGQNAASRRIAYGLLARGTSKNPILGRIAASIVQCDPRNTDVLLRFAPCAASRLMGF